MRYKDLLEDYIKKSGLSHREISRRCKDNGKPVSQGYISQLVKGDTPPPKEDVSRALAEVIGKNPEELIWQGYLEKTPAGVTEVLENKTQEIEQLNKQIENMSVRIEVYNDELSRLEMELASLQCSIGEKGLSSTDNTESFYEWRRIKQRLESTVCRLMELREDKQRIKEIYSSKLKEALRHQEETTKNHLNTFLNLPEYIQRRVLDVATYIYKTRASARQAAQVYEVSEDTVYKDMLERLPLFHNDMAQEVKRILEKNEEDENNG